MIAVKAMRYAGRDLMPGDEFEPQSDRDARLLRAIGKAKVANPVDDTDRDDDGKPEKRAYRRKDMKAED